MKDLSELEKPKNETEFKPWLKAAFGVDINAQYEFYYETVVQKLKSDFEQSDFWKKTIAELPELNDKYRIEKGVHLLIPLNIPKIYSKSLNSLIVKAYRKNILNNTNYPSPPDGGWITPNNWFERIKDIIRTTLTVKYLDGVEILINELENISRQFEFKFTSSFEAREEGYYAAHSGIMIPLSIPNFDFLPVPKDINIEIQVTTQIQEIIKTLLHTHYENNRKVLAPKDYKWQWDYQSPEFTSNYLGHIIHYVEGMIVDIRDKEK
jgi:ppGpp synthetase/RelA/SpoT-type nucleotidyltranferase